MALIWADFPSEQQGLYGTDITKMLNGIYADIGGAGDDITLVSDPDPNIGDNGVVVQVNNNNVSAAVYVRLTYPAAVDTAGVAFRLWMTSYPSGDSASGPPQWEFRNISNTLIARIRIGASGQFLVYNAAGTLVHTSDPAVVLANAYNHIETKVVRHASAGTLEIRVNGSPKVTLTGLALGSSDIVNIVYGQIADLAGTIVCYFKDIVYWDNQGSAINDFVGAVFVHDLVPNADNTLNWDISATLPTTGFNLIDDFLPSNVLTASGAIIDGTVIRIQDTYYRWSTGSLDSSSPAGTSANPWRVLLGADTATAMSNLFKAIGATGVAGTDYSTALTAHEHVNADWVNATQLGIEGKTLEDTGYTCTENGANLVWASATITAGSSQDQSYISADNTLPAESIFELTDLPEDVIAIRAVMPIGRLLKSDGGDCTVQMGVSPNGVDWDDGEDRAVTVAATFYRDVSYVSPDTGAAWTPTEVNDMLIRVDRTT